MAASGPLLTPEQIRAVLIEVGERLASQGLCGTVVIAGGSFLALNGWRAEGTRDVDAVTRLDEAVKAAAADVAGVHGFTLDWLNDRALPFVPSTFEVERCAVLIEHEGLHVLGPPSDIVFLMKLAAARPGQDHADMIALWPHCTFDSAATAVVRSGRATRWSPTIRSSSTSSTTSHGPQARERRRPRRSRGRTCVSECVSECVSGLVTTSVDLRLRRLRARVTPRVSGQPPHVVHR